MPTPSSSPRSAPDIAADAVPVCQSCAACCFGEGERYVPVSGDDHARIGDQAQHWTRFVGNRCFMKMQDGHCLALRWDRQAGQFSCAIHPLRPQVCRDLERGSAACDVELERKRRTAARQAEDLDPA